MDMHIVTETALAVAAVCGVGLVVAVPAAAAAALHGNGRRMLRASSCALVLALLAFTAFAILGGTAAGYITHA